MNAGFAVMIILCLFLGVLGYLIVDAAIELYYTIKYKDEFIECADAIIKKDKESIEATRNHKHFVVTKKFKLTNTTTYVIATWDELT